MTSPSFPTPFRVFLLGLIWLGCCLTGSVQAAARPVLAHELALRLLLDEQTLVAEDLITIRDGARGLPRLYLLEPQAVVEQVQVDDTPTAFKFEQGKLLISGAMERARSVRIAYRIRCSDPVPENTVGIEDPSFGIRATIGGHGAFLGGNVAWVPAAPSQPAVYAVTVIGPPGLVSVTSGRLEGIDHQEDQTVSRWRAERPQSAIALAAGFYEVAAESLGDLQILTFLGKDNATLARSYLDACREYLALYQELFGPYPYAKFAVVENFFPTGYGLPGWTLLGSTVIRLPFIRTTSLPHEIAHAWWGNAVEVDYATGNWCEGLATYVADYLLKERSDPREAREYRLKLLREYATLVNESNDYPLRDFRSRKSKVDQAIGYGKAAMVFHMLRNRIGDAAFWEGLRKVVREDAGTRVSWDDLQRRFEEVSAQDLETFFDQWVDRAGAPQLALAEVRAEATPRGQAVVGEVRQAAPAYQLDLPLELLHAGGERRELVRVAGPRTRFRLPAPERPQRLTGDPDTDLFRRLTDAEIPVTVNALRAARDGLVVLADGADPELLQASADLLRGLHWQGATVVKEKDLTAGQATGNLLVIGWPHNATLPVTTPSSIAAGPARFEVDGRVFGNPADALFLVLPGAATRGVVGIFHPLSPAAARRVARKIPHYGRYSFLAFTDGANQAKGTWPPEESPLTVTLE